MLTDAAVRAARPRVDVKVTKLADAGGLYILIQAVDAKYWRWDYRYGGKRKTLSLGTYPDVTLAAARAKRDEARRLLAAGTDPGRARHQQKLAERRDTVAALAEEWLTQQAKVVGPVTLKKKRDLLDAYLLPAIGGLPIGRLTPRDVLQALRPLDLRGVHETAHRGKQILSQLLRYAVATDRASRDVSADLRGALTPATVTHHAAITDPAQLGALLRAIDGCDGFAPVRYALQIAPRVFVRPGELRKAEWTEIDWAAALWRIPGARMKMREPHLVPLAPPCLALFRDLHAVTGRGRYLFPAVRTASRPMSNGTINAALRRLGYTNDQQTGHGFRTIASTRLHELGWPTEVIEAQLAHRDQNKVRAAYNQALWLEQRVKMMAAWNTYLDGVKRLQLKLVAGGAG